MMMKSKKRKGFSLLEVIIVVMGLFIITAGAHWVPKGLAMLELLYCQEEIYAHVAHARVLAITRGEDIYCILEEESLIIKSMERRYHVFELSKSIQFRLTKTIAFTSSGTTKSPGTLWLSKNGIERKVSVSAGFAGIHR